jgi:hypothetical protein
MHGHKTAFNPSLSTTLIPEFSAAFIIEPVPLLAKGIPSSPGEHRVAIRAKADSPDGKKLSAYRVYIRRPGPASEEPKTVEEWDRFFERCLQNRRAELLEAMRPIMTGVIANAAPAYRPVLMNSGPSRQKPLPAGKPLLRRSTGKLLPSPARCSRAD